MRIFGRDPALWLAAIQAVLSILVGFQWDSLSATQASLWMAAINAVLTVVTAWMIAPVSPVVYTGLFSALAALGAAYGLHLSQEMVGSVNVAVVAVLTLITRAQISPVLDASKTGVLGDRVTAK